MQSSVGVRCVATVSASAAEAILNHAREGTKKNYDHHRYERQIETALTLRRDKLVEIIAGALVPAWLGMLFRSGGKRGRRSEGGTSTGKVAVGKVEGF